ncbi:MAG: tetraacyldisaccharide 4'-kinase [Candidatus Gastranaerophilaceae bacterium]
MNLKSEITKIHYDKNSKSWILPLLEFFAFFYDKITKYRNQFYDKGILKSEKVDSYVISVGNLTTGGVGKTPVVAELAKYYIKQGKKVAIISRGYGGKLSNKEPRVVAINGEILHTAEEIGDEPYWFAQNIENIAVVTCSNRVKAANMIIKSYHPDIIILDDAFQHRKIQRDLDIVLVDSEKYFGNGKHLPAGPLRENLNGLKRADKVLIINKTLEEVDMKKLPNVFDLNKVSICKVEPSYVYNIKTTDVLPLNSNVVAMCAIGQPKQFYDFVADKYNILGTITFDDHHAYKESDLENIDEIIITTEKDAVKLEKFNFDNIYAMKLKLKLNVEELIK